LFVAVRDGSPRLLRQVLPDPDAESGRGLWGWSSSWRGPGESVPIATGARSCGAPSTCKFYDNGYGNCRLTFLLYGSETLGGRSGFLASAIRIGDRRGYKGRWQVNPPRVQQAAAADPPPRQRRTSSPLRWPGNGRHGRVRLLPEPGVPDADQASGPTRRSPRPVAFGPRPRPSPRSGSDRGYAGCPTRTPSLPPWPAAPCSSCSPPPPGPHWRPRSTPPRCRPCSGSAPCPTAAPGPPRPAAACAGSTTR
jgi:hypothetical protein